MEAKIIRVQQIKDEATSSWHFHAVLECQRCGKPYDFNFNAGVAEIMHQYMAEDIAMGYIKRAAPVLCTPCLCL